MEAGAGGTQSQPRDAWSTRSWKRQEGPPTPQSFQGERGLRVRTPASRLGEGDSLWRRVSVVEAGVSRARGGVRVAAAEGSPNALQASPFLAGLAVSVPRSQGLPRSVLPCLAYTEVRCRPDQGHPQGLAHFP